MKACNQFHKPAGLAPGKNTGNNRIGGRKSILPLPGFDPQLFQPIAKERTINDDTLFQFQLPCVSLYRFPVRIGFHSGYNYLELGIPVLTCGLAVPGAALSSRWTLDPSAAARRLPATPNLLFVLTAVQATGVPNERNFAEQLRLYTKGFLSPLQPQEGPHLLLRSGGETMLAVASTTTL